MSKTRTRSPRLALLLGVLLATAAAIAGLARPAHSATTASGSTQLKAAQKAVSAAMKAPTNIGVTKPLKSKPPAGRTVVWLEADFVQSQETAAAMGAAAKAAGLKLKVIDYTAADPATLIAAFKQALQYHPLGVALSGINAAVWGSQIYPLYQKAGVPIVEGLAVNWIKVSVVEGINPIGQSNA